MKNEEILREQVRKWRRQDRINLTIAVVALIFWVLCFICTCCVAVHFILKFW